MRARVRGWWKWWRWKTASTLENELARSCSRVVESGGGGKQLPPSKTSLRARVRGWWKVVEVENSFHPRKRACALVFEGGGRWWRWKTASTLENEHAHSCSRVVEGGGGGK